MLCYYSILLLGIKDTQQQYKGSVVMYCNSLNEVFQKLSSHAQSLPQILQKSVGKFTQIPFWMRSGTNPVNH